MRIATWNVNSVKARLDKVRWWLDRARSDGLMMQETPELLDDHGAPEAPVARPEDPAIPPRANSPSTR
jgi:exodeoxyribonuclease-3